MLSGESREHTLPSTRALASLVLPSPFACIWEEMERAWKPPWKQQAQKSVFLFPSDFLEQGTLPCG